MTNDQEEFLKEVDDETGNKGTVIETGDDITETVESDVQSDNNNDPNFEDESVSEETNFNTDAEAATSTFFLIGIIDLYLLVINLVQKPNDFKLPLFKLEP